MRRLDRWDIGRSEQALVLVAMVLSAAIVVAFVLVRRHHPLVGDASEYNSEGRFIASGHWWWSTAPYGIPHPSAWKAPGYPAFVGALYAILGNHFVGVELAQGLLLAPLTVGLTWWLGRRLFGPRAGVAAGCLVSIYPAVWQWEGMLYSEAVAIPLTLALLIAVLGREPTRPRAVAVGLLLGILILVRPSSIALLALVGLAWLLAAGLRRGVAYTGVSVVVAILTVAPWTIRNAIVLHGFLPVSVQDAAAYGTFNGDAANDPVWPYEWRPVPRDAMSVLDRRHPLSEVALHAKLEGLATSYVKKHPSSVLEAFFWNGLSRTWDVRRPSRILFEPHFEGRSRALTAVGMGMWWLFLALALAGLSRWRRRRKLVLPILALALATSVVFTTESGTRYRATLEPLAVIIACSAVPVLVRRDAAQACARAACEPETSAESRSRSSVIPRRRSNSSATFK